MCENKEIIDPVIYKKIVDLKNDLVKGTSTVLFFHTCFKGSKRLDAQIRDVILAVNTRIADLKLYLQLSAELQTSNNYERSDSEL